MTTLSTENRRVKAVGHEICWAKTDENGRPGVSVEQHLRTAGAVAARLAALWPEPLRDLLLTRAGVALAALHDVGKVSPGFQRKCTAWWHEQGFAPTDFLSAEQDHGKVSQRTVQELLGDDSRRFWAAIVGAHHGQLKGDRLGPLADGGEHWEAERRRLVETLNCEFGRIEELPPVSGACGFLWFNAGLIAVADWLASDERAFPPGAPLDRAEIDSRVQGLLDRIGMRPLSRMPGRHFASLFPFEPNPLQALLEEAVSRPGIYVVEAPMGGGKTEAALMAAYNLLATGQATGIYFALPTQVTSNRIHERVQSFLQNIEGPTGARLVHGNSWLLDIEQPMSGKQFGESPATEGQHDGRDWFASSRRALLAPIGVGTVDQALLGVVAAKHFFVRQFALAGKVVILDEVHSYDLYTGTLIDVLIRRLRELGATVIVLSATLTAARCRELLVGSEAAERNAVEAYPRLSSAVDGKITRQAVSEDPKNPPRTVAVRQVPEMNLIDDCLSRAEAGACVLWIRNTVATAQETYRRLRCGNREGGPEIGLLHSRFPLYRREELEGDWLTRLGKDSAKRPVGGCVLVATQVAEQSVDIDADLLITDLAPTDILLQRIGRLWRHERPRPPGCEREVWIVEPGLGIEALRAATVPEIKQALGGSAKVYAPYVLLRTLELWQDRETLRLPSDIRPLLESTYSEPTETEPNAWGVLRKQMLARRDTLKAHALAHSNPFQIALSDEECVQTRWGSAPSVGLLLVRKIFKRPARDTVGLELLDGTRCDASKARFDFATAKALHRNIAKVPVWCCRNVGEKATAWLQPYARNGELACKLDGERLLFVDSGDDSLLRYRDDLGVVLPRRDEGWGSTAHLNKEEDDEFDVW